MGCLLRPAYWPLVGNVSCNHPSTNVRKTDDNANFNNTLSMKKSFCFLFLAPAMMLTSCYVTPEDGPYAPPPPGPHVGGVHPRHPLSPGGTVVLPREARRVSYRGQVYYNHHDTWYRPSGSSYVVVNRPSGYMDPRNPRSPYSPGGTVVLPREARRVSYRGQVYYTHRNVWYRPSGSSYVIVRSPY